jgi:hypothetical protein
MAEDPGAPNQGAFAGAPPPAGAGSGPPPDDAGPAATGAPVNQGATGAGPHGEGAYRGGSAGSPSGSHDPFAERPELFVGGAFVGGFALAMLLRRLGS